MKSSDDDSSESDTDYAFQEDMEALKRACLLTGSNPDSLDFVTAGKESDDNVVSHGGVSPVGSSSDDDDDDKDDVEDDFKLVRDIQKRFHQFKKTEGEEEPLPHVELKFSISSVCSDNEEDDFETLRAIQRRCAAYSASRTQESIEKAVSKSEQVGVTNIDSEKETSSNCFVESSNAWEGFPDCVDKSSSTTQTLEAFNTTAAGTCNTTAVGTAADDSDIGPVKGSSFPKSARAFIDAIKKNRSCQQLIRSSMLRTEARIEEIKKLKDRVKILKDFQTSCKVRTGRALSQKKDPRVQLISAMKPKTDSKVNGKSSAMNYGPTENSQAAAYREVLEKFPIFIKRETWSSKEKENLAKGMRQQIQQMLMQRLCDSISTADVDSVASSIGDRDFTPDEIREFLPNVNWKDLAELYLPSRSGAECETRWRNFEDPLINHSPWSTEEDKKLLQVIQLKGLNNWIDTANFLGTNRTPFQCLARYQRSLNPSFIKREWTKEEDNQLRAAVEAFGECDWQAVASSMEGRTGTQCSNRWMKSLHPSRQKVGKWSDEEDERLKVAVMLFGPKTWRKVAESLPGRTHVQCRERWVNSLDPSLSLTEWTVEEDERLKEAIHVHGYCWSKVATCVPARTDNQCWRRWKTLCPNDVPLLQAARRIQRVALVSNFVDRESERSYLGPGDFVPPPNVDCVAQLEWKDESAAADRTKSDLCNEEAPRPTDGTRAGNAIRKKKRQIPFRKKQGDLCNEEAPRSTNGTRAGKSIRNKKRKIPLSKKRNTKDSMYKEFKLLDEDSETENSMSSLSDANLPNEDAKSHERPSKLQPRRKCRDRQESKVVDYGECFSSSDDDPSLPNGEVGRKNEDAKSHRRPSKLQPRRHKHRDRQDTEVVENRECISSFDVAPSLANGEVGRNDEDATSFDVAPSLPNGEVSRNDEDATSFDVDLSLPNGEVGRNNKDAKRHKTPSKLQPRKRKRLDRQDTEVVENGECISPFDVDPSLPNGEVGRNSEDAKIHKTPSKLQPRKRKRLNRQETEVVENGECLSSFDDDPNLLMSSPGKNADDLFGNDRDADISGPNQVETDDGNKIIWNEKEVIIVYKRKKRKNIQAQQNNSCPSPKPLTTSESIPPKCRTAAKASGKRHRNCSPQPIRSSLASAIVENGSSKASPSYSPELKRSRRLQAQDYLNKMMEEDDDISLASYIQHIKRLRRKGTSKGVEGY